MKEETPKLKYSVLVVDDDFSRDDAYKKIIDYAKKKEVCLEIDFFHNAGDASEAIKLYGKKYQLAIVDAILDEDDPYGELDRIVTALMGKKIPYALISSGWNQSMADAARQAARKYTPVSWFRFPENQDDIDAVSSLVIELCHNFAEQSWVGTPYKSIDILHLSDLHFGNVGDMNTLKNRTTQLVDFLHKKKVKPRFIAITGDIAHTGNPYEYELAKNWLSDFIDRLHRMTGFEPNVLSIPGNHDHSVALENSPRVSIKKMAVNKLQGRSNNETREDVELVFNKSKSIDTDEDKYLANYARLPYQIFWNHFHGNQFQPQTSLQFAPAANADAWLDSRFLHIGLLFMGINTTESGNPLPKVGIPSERQGNLHQLMTEVGELLENDRFKLPVTPCTILLMHHSLQTVRNQTKLIMGHSLKPWMTLQGHEHHPNTTSENANIVIIRASTSFQEAASRNEDTLRGVNWIRTRCEPNGNRWVRVVEIDYRIDDWEANVNSARAFEFDNSGRIVLEKSSEDGSTWQEMLKDSLN